MSHPIEQIRAAAALAREAGLIEAANDLESVTWAAYTTSSEMAGVFGAAIGAFLSRTHGRLPAPAADILVDCLADLRSIWPEM